MDREKTSFATMGRTSSGISIKFLGAGQSDGGDSSGGNSTIGRNLSLRAMGKSSAGSAATLGKDYGSSIGGSNSGFHGLTSGSSGYSSNIGNPNGTRSDTYGSVGGSGTPVSIYGTGGTPSKRLSTPGSSSLAAGDQEDVNHQLNAVKLKLEERRRKIEEEKKKMEQLMVKQREKVGQEAFLRAVSRGIRRVESQGPEQGNELESTSGVKQEILDLAHNISKTTSPAAAVSSNNNSFAAATNVTPRKAGFNLRLSSGDSSRGDDLKTPDVDTMDISRMSDSLQSIQSDIQRLALQQSQIQNIMNNQQRGVSQEPERKSFYISQPDTEKHQRGFYISDNRSPAQEDIKSANTTVRRTWGTPQPMLLPEQHHQYQHHNQGHLPPGDQYSSVYSTPAEQFPVHHVAERPTLLNQGGGFSQQYHMQGAPQQYSGYNQQQQQPLNGGSPRGGGGGYHPPPSYNRPLSAPGGGGYMNPVSSAQGYSGYGSNQYGGGSGPSYPEPYGSTFTHIQPNNSDVQQHQHHHQPQLHQQQMQHQTYEGPGTVRINLSRNNSFNSQQQQRHLHMQQQTNIYTSPANTNYSEPIYSEPPAAASVYGGGNSLAVTASPNPGRPRSTPAFTQVEERSLVPPAIAEKPANLSALAHFQQRRNAAAAANRSSGSGSPMSETPPHHHPVENLYESVDHGYTKSRSPSPAPVLHAQPSPAVAEHYYETLEPQATPPRSFSSPRTSLTMNRSGRPSLETCEPRQLDFNTPSRLRDSNSLGSPSSNLPPSGVIGKPSLPPTAAAGQLEDQEMTSSTIETLNTMKTETIGDTSDAKGFVISFDNDSPVKPKPVLRPKRTSRRESLTSGISNDSVSSDRRDSTTTNISGPAKTPDDSLQISQDSKQSSALSYGSIASTNQSIRNNLQQERDISTTSSSNPLSSSNNLEGKLEVRDQYSNIQNENSSSQSELCVLCEISEIQQPILKLCSKCSNVLKANINSPEALLRCSKVGACDPEEYCPKCMIEKSKCMDLFDKIRDNFQEANPSLNSALDDKKLEWVQMMTLKRKQQAEEARVKREEEARKRREDEEAKKAEQAKKKEDEKRRREEIFEQYKIKKELEKEDKAPSHPPPTSSNKTGPRMRPRSAGAGGMKPRPRTIHVDSDDLPDGRTGGQVTRSSSGLRGSHSNLNISSLNRSRNYRRGSNSSLADEELYGGVSSGLRGLGHIGRSKSSSVSNLGPGSLPLGLRRGLSGGHRSEYGSHRGETEFDDRASDISSTTSGYRSGRVSARLYREPVSKSNRPIVMNAIEFVVFPGAVNRETRMRLLEEIERCDCPHFLLLFRDNRLQFRALYAFYPDTEEVFKIYGNGPKQIVDNMIDNYYKYNSGGKKFTQIHTKHLTVTIDAFTIHNGLWLGKKTRLPDKKGLPLVI